MLKWYQSIGQVNFSYVQRNTIKEGVLKTNG